MQTLPRPLERIAGFFKKEPARPDVPNPGTPPRAPTIGKEEARILDLVTKRYDYARDAKKPLLETWATCLAFYVGEHYREWGPRQQRLLPPKPIPDWRVRTKDNQIPGILDTAANKLGRSRKEPKALANTDEPEDHAAAELGTTALRYWWDRDEMERKELEANFGRLLFGSSFFHDLWDPGKMARVPIPQISGFDPLGAPIIKQEVRRVAVGDVTVEILSVFDVFPEPVEEWNSITWCVVARRKPLSWFRDTFPVEGKWVTADSGKTEDVFAGFFQNGEFSAQTSAPQGDGMATLLVYYEKPCRDYPKGRHAMVAGGRVLFARDSLPLPHLEIPVAMMGYRYVPKRLWPKGLVEELIGPQQELNRGQSNLAEIVRLFRSFKWVVSKGSVDEKAITSKPDEVIEFRGNTPPQVQGLPNLPAQIMNYPEMQRENLRHLSGQRDLAPGGIPPGVTAASALALVDQQNNERLSTPAKYGRQAIQTVSTRVLATMAERYREDRLFSTFGRDRKQQIQAFQGADIGDRDVLVDATEGVQDTDAVRFQQLSEWFQLRVFDLMQTTPPFAQMFPQLLRDVGQEWLADDMEKYGQALIEELQRQEQQQQAMMQEQQQAALAVQQGEQEAAAQAQQMELEGKAQEQELKAEAAQQQQALQAQSAMQNQMVGAAQSQQALAQSEATHRQQLAHTDEKHALSILQQRQAMMLAAQQAKQREHAAKKPAAGARK